MSQLVAIGPRYKNTSTSLNYETTGSNTCNKSQAQTHICTRLCEYKDKKMVTNKKKNLYGETETSSGVTCASVNLRIWSHSSSHLLLTAHKEEVTPVRRDISSGSVKQQLKGWEDVNLWVRVCLRGLSQPNILYITFTLKDCGRCSVCVALVGYRMWMMRTCDPAVDQHRHKQQVLAPTHHLELQSPPARAAAWRASKVQVRGWSDGSFTGIPLRRAGFARPMCFLTGRSYSDPMYDIFLNLTQPRPLHNDANGPKVITSHTRWSVGQQALFWKFNRMLNLLICPRNWQNWYSRCRESIIWPVWSDDCFLLWPLMCNMWLWIKSVILSSPLPSYLTRYTTSHSTYLCEMGASLLSATAALKERRRERRSQNTSGENKLI